jgi:hypothetical protein
MMEPVAGFIHELPPEGAVQIVTLNHVNVHDLAEYATKVELATLLPDGVEELVVPHTDKASMSLGCIKQLFGLNCVN